MIFFQGKTTAHTDLSSLSYLNVLRKCGAEDASTHTIYCRTSHCERNLYLCTSPHHARNELSHVSYHRQSKKKHMLWNNASKWMMWLYLWSCIMDICRRCIFPSSSCSEALFNTSTLVFMLGYSLFTYAEYTVHTLCLFFCLKRNKDLLFKSDKYF